MKQIGQRRREAFTALFVGEARVCSPQSQIRYQTIKLPTAALNYCKSTLMYLVGWDSQAHIEVLFQTTPDKITNELIHGFTPLQVSGIASLRVPITLINDG